MFKRNRKLRENRKLSNKMRSLLKFHLKVCKGITVNESGKSKVLYCTTLAMNHFIKQEKQNE